VDLTASLDCIERREFLTLTGFELRPLVRPAKSLQVYRLRYIGSILYIKEGKDLNTRVVRKIRFPRSCSREERCYEGSGDTGV
jgi:hypothetical protein